jgi:hypothetical protein
VTITPQNGHLVWPSPYDLVPSLIHFVWSPEGTFTSTEMTKLIAGQGYDLELRVDDEKLVEASNGILNDFYITTMTGDFTGCPSGKTCLGTSVRGAKMFSYPGVWDMKLTFWKEVLPGQIPDKANILADISPNPTPKSYFAEKVGPIFKHARCSTCHSLGSKDAIVAQHHGMVSLSDIYETPTDHGTQLRCSNCHGGIKFAVPGEGFNETEWMVPKFDMGIDWTGKTFSQICAKVKSRLTTKEAMEEHFFEDARIAWAVHSGVVPGGTMKPKAPPGNFADFKVLMEAWIQGGSPCP